MGSSSTALLRFAGRSGVEGLSGRGHDDVLVRLEELVAPALDYPAAVTLPEPVILTGALAEDSPRTFDREALTLTWQPGTADFRLYAFMWTVVDDNDRLSPLCRMQDDGTFTIPPELTCHFPQTDEAFISVMRTDQRLLTTEDERTIVVDADAYLVRQVVLE